LEAVKAAYEEAEGELDQADFAGITPLQKAALNGWAEVVEFLIEKGCRTDCESGDRDTPLIDAVENGHLEVVRFYSAKGRSILITRIRKASVQLTFSTAKTKTARTSKRNSRKP